MAIDVGGAPAPVAPRAGLGRWPLRGRARELQVLKEAVRERRGAVIAGPAGSGKTVLAQAGVEFAQDQGMSVAAVAGTEAARSYPFGALATLLPPGLAAVGPESHADLLRYYARELLDTAGGRPLLLFVDDAHLLDDGSSMLMHQLSLNASAAVLACVLTTVPTSHPLTDPTVVLWKDHEAARIELGPLGEESIEELLFAVLGGPIDAVSFRQIVGHTRGDPLYLRELVTGALASGALTDESGVWRLRGPMRPTRRLVELVSLRLGRLSEAERHVLELTAIGEPLAQPSLDELTERAAVESLEDKGFLTSGMDGRRLQVRLAHPVLTDVVRLGITPRRERALARALAETSVGRRREDTLLMASLRLVGGGGNAELLLAGAKAARESRDFGLTERLARAAIEQGAGFDARLLAAEAAHLGRRHGEAERELGVLARDAATDSERIRVALLQFDLAFFSRGVADVAAIDTLLKTAVDPAWRGELLARRLCGNGAAQGPRAVVDAVPVPCAPAASTPRSSLQSVLGGCLTRTGRLEDALGLLVPPPLEVEDPGDPAAIVAWSTFGNRALALVGLGRLDEAERLIERERGDLVGATASPEGAVVAASLAALRLEQGRVRDAFLQAASAAGTYLDLGLPVAARRCYALSATSLALAGLAAKASETLGELDALGLPADLTYEVEVLQARAWAWAAGGDMATARQNLEMAAELGVEVGDLLGATTALHGLARLGRARQVVDQLGELATQVEGELTATRLFSARAAANRDTGGLEEAANRFEAIGAHLYAAEALGEAAVHLRRGGLSREATAAQQRAARLLAGCEGAVTPFVRAIGARAQLTPAELDTALHAASGSTDKQIAELMHLSVRTVENRLHRAYQKLGLSHRRELTEALRDRPVGEAPGREGQKSRPSGDLGP
jgi:DNA-binding CsgD family transcriptional regulator/type II secretory pathway predicted ATPase ExeA